MNKNHIVLKFFKTILLHFLMSRNIVETFLGWRNIFLEMGMKLDMEWTDKYILSHREPWNGNVCNAD